MQNIFFKNMFFCPEISQNHHSHVFPGPRTTFQEENRRKIFIDFFVFFCITKRVLHMQPFALLGGGAAPPRTPPRPQDKRILVYTPSVLVANHTNHGHLQSYIYTFLPLYNSSPYTPSVLLHVTVTMDTFLPLHTTRHLANHT